MSECKFKAGDTVVRVDSAFAKAEVGCLYVVHAVKYSEYEGKLLGIILEDLEGNLLDGNFGYDEKYFDLATKPRKHAELIKQWADDDSLEIEFRVHAKTPWAETYPTFYNEYDTRIKPKEKTELEILKEEAEALNKKIQLLENV